ncbi:MAG: UDP-N-acetylmuramate--L-alanine ligase, partial [Akkermansiaceae bacterium]|nr:UDP-N-acetylmuramate--L-alanine ligase [Armatimonadota bacterium]
GIAIAGTHGKTTTAGMVASILMAANLDPTVLIGGDLPLIGGNARNGKGEFVVAESCEAYDGFLYLHPEVAVILNIEADHLDYHGTEQHVFDSFDRFARQVKRFIIACAEDEHTGKFTQRLKTNIEAHFVEYGDSEYTSSVELYKEIDGTIEIANNGFPVFDEDAKQINYSGVGPLRLKVPGRHNELNATAAVCVALAIGIAPEHIVAGLESFTGTGRRFERLGEVGGVTVIDDYAHHPTELRATLSAARSAFPGRRIVAVFQPHLPSRTRDLMGEFAEALAHEYADAVFVTDIYLAREQPIVGVTSEVLADAIDALGNRPEIIRYVPDKADLPEHLAAFVQSGDVVITLGAGDIRAAGEGFLRLLK